MSYLDKFTLKGFIEFMNSEEVGLDHPIPKSYSTQQMLDFLNFKVPEGSLSQLDKRAGLIMVLRSKNCTFVEIAEVLGLKYPAMARELYLDALKVYRERWKNWSKLKRKHLTKNSPIYSLNICKRSLTYMANNIPSITKDMPISTFYKYRASDIMGIRGIGPYYFELIQKALESNGFERIPDDD